MTKHLPSIEQLAQNLKDGSVTAVQLTERALRLAGDPAGEGSRTFTQLYPENALQQATASDLLRSQQGPRSVLEGIPVSIKDLFDVAGEATWAGSKVLREELPARQDSEVVRLLRQAGAVLIGKTNMTEFAYSGLGMNPHFGTPSNPWQRGAKRIPGGSSSGAAVSVSDGMSAVAIGTDTGGSIRIPAALCGLVGFKPTAGKISMQGAIPLSPTLDSAGIIATSVACAARVYALLSNDALSIVGRPLASLSLAVPTSLVLNDMDEKVSSDFKRALAAMSAQGARIVEIPLTELQELADINASGGFSALESYQWHKKYLDTGASLYDPRVLSRILRGKPLNEEDFMELNRRRKDWQTRVVQGLNGFDALVMPTVPMVAPLIEPMLEDDALYFKTNALMLRNPAVINFLGGCAISVPCSRSGTAPVGFSIAMLDGNEQALVSIALEVERLFHSPSFQQDKA